jgi:hypothetical protein
MRRRNSRESRRATSAGRTGLESDSAGAGERTSKAGRAETPGDRLAVAA